MITRCPARQFPCEYGDGRRWRVRSTAFRRFCGSPEGGTPNRRGFALVVMLIALILLTVFALVAGEVFNNSIRAIRTSGEIHNQLNSFEGLLASLREDAWSARGVRVEDPHKAVLSGSAGQEIIWSITGTGEFVRTAGANVCRWRKLDVPLSFAAHPAGLLLQQGARPEDSLVLQSQFLAVERSRP